MAKDDYLLAVKTPENEDKSTTSTSTELELQKDVEDHITRDRWSTKVDFIIACVGLSIGFGNVWRFPYLCYKNGGGAFLVPFFLSAALGGVPTFFLEVIMGQFMSSAGIRVWNMAPLLSGIGVGCCVILFFTNCYYNILLTWSFYYLFASFTTGPLPWAGCDGDWNTDFCSTVPLAYNKSLNTTEGDKNCFVAEKSNSTYCGAANFSRLVDPTVEYWERQVLDLSDGIEHLGTINWGILVCFIITWIVVYVCICKGIKSSGKVMYVTATAPYVAMVVLAAKGLSLDGAMDGVLYYLKPDLSRLDDPQVWADAGTQVFFSYTVSLGALHALGSYNSWHHNALRDSIAFSCIDSFTCLLAGFVVFPILGHMAHERGVPIADVVESGPGLAFIAYPKAIALLPWAPFWSILFFLMLIMLGLDSQFVGVEGFVAALTDYLPAVERSGRRKAVFIAVCVFLKLLVGLSMICQGGMYVFQIFDYYAGSRMMILFAALECIAVSWVYGVDLFYENMTTMFGFRPPICFKYLWKFITPAFCISVFVLNAIQYTELSYKRRVDLIYQFPGWAIGCGWALASLALTALPLTAIYRVVQSPHRGTLFSRIRRLTLPVLRAHQVADSLRSEDYIEDTRDDLKHSVPS